MSGFDQTTGRSPEETHLSASGPTSAPSGFLCNRSVVFASSATLPLLTQCLVCCIHRLNPQSISCHSVLVPFECPLSPLMNWYSAPITDISDLEIRSSTIKLTSGNQVQGNWLPRAVSFLRFYFLHQLYRQALPATKSSRRKKSKNLSRMAFVRSIICCSSNLG